MVRVPAFVEAVLQAIRGWTGGRLVVRVNGLFGHRTVPARPSVARIIGL